ncbi:MAG: dihydroorotate dehydrogenase electron transfer subunit [Ruminococcaceae bacterium]|nr:dihydroorotate dehydrogenase electron transfer subunit [Oscillospiraceae bacterium]
MMKQTIFQIISNKNIAKDVYEMVLEGDTSGIAPGQFVNLKLEGLYLRRPISVCDYSDKTLTLVYKVVGKGTEQMAKMNVGESVDVLTGLGNGYNSAKSGESPLLIGGGVGVPPMYALAKRLISEGKSVSVILGFNKAEEIFYEEEFKKLGAEVYVTTVDGSVGTKGFVTDAVGIVGDYTYVYTCGPEVMLKAVYNAIKTSGQFSFEERMGCGFGACMGCTCKTKYGNKRICKDGPVLEKEEIIW